jgi:hypothetical protein
MSRKRKVDKDELYRMLAEGKSVKECAKHFGVSSPAISQHKKDLGSFVVTDVQLASAGRIVDEHLNTVQQLQQINADAHELLEICMRWLRGEPEALQILESQVRKVRIGKSEKFVDEYKFKDPREIALKAMQRIESQLRLQNETLALLTNVKAIHEFQQDVIRILKEVVPEEIADEFCRKWDKSRAVPRLLQLTKPRA